MKVIQATEYPEYFKNTNPYCPVIGYEIRNFKNYILPVKELIDGIYYMPTFKEYVDAGKPVPTVLEEWLAENGDDQLNYDPLTFDEF